jgi:putative exporter of polyketide antibiotics
MAAAPAVDPNWTVNGVMVAIGAATALVGIASFRRRDLLAL